MTVLHDPSRVLLGPHRGSTVPLVLDRQCSGRASRTSTSSPAELLLQLLIWFQSAFTTVQESSSCHKVVKYRSREARFSSPSCSTQNSRPFTLRLTENFLDPSADSSELSNSRHNRSLLFFAEVSFRANCFCFFLFFKIKYQTNVNL